MSVLEKNRIVVNIDNEIKQSFLRIAKYNDTDGSKLIRLFIKEYIKKNNQGSLNL